MRFLHSVHDDTSRRPPDALLLTMMKVPQYTPSRFTKSLQRRILTGLLVALAAMILGFVSFPVARRHYYLSQLDNPQPVRRAKALNVLTRLAVKEADLCDQIEAAFVAGFKEGNDQMDLALVPLASWAVQKVPSFRDRFLVGLDTNDDAVFRGLAAALREAGYWSEDHITLEYRCRRLALRCEVADAEQRAVAVLALAQIGPAAERHLIRVLLANLKHGDPTVRLAAVEAISICLPRSRTQLLREASTDYNLAVRNEADARLKLLRSRTPPPAQEPPVEVARVIESLRSGDYDARLQAMARVGYLGEISDDEKSHLVTELKEIVDQGLSTGNGGLAGGALEAIAALGDRRYVPVMLDVAAGFSDQPMLRLMAARAASRLDAEAGGQALINLFGQESDVVRDLAAITLCRLEHPAVLEGLKSELYSTELEVRGPAALALALRNDPDLAVRDRTLIELLTKRTTLLKDNPLAEPEWKPRGYYLCSLLILGDDSVRDLLDVFEMNEHFPRIAIYIARLHSGDTSPLDLVLSDGTYSDHSRMEFLRDLRFGEIIAAYVPEAPRVAWSDSLHHREAQVKTLARWWSLFRWDFVFDSVTHHYRLAAS